VAEGNATDLDRHETSDAWTTKRKSGRSPRSQVRKLDNGRNNPNPKPGVIVGQKVTPKNGQAVTVTKVNQDGTFEYR
jgi:hypothetical protein